MPASTTSSARTTAPASAPPPAAARPRPLRPLPHALPHRARDRYHNRAQFIDLFTSRGFWPGRRADGARAGRSGPREARPISNGYAQAFSSPSTTRTPSTSPPTTCWSSVAGDNGNGNVIGNVLVAVNDSYSSGVQRYVAVSYNPGTLHELTGNHADPVVDLSRDPRDSHRRQQQPRAHHRPGTRTPKRRGPPQGVRRNGLAALPHA